MRVLDLFAGLGGWSQAFRDRGHDVVRVEWDTRFEAEIHADILEIGPGLLEKHGPYDLILASPPCECFSVASIGHHWGGGHRAYAPKTEAAITAMKLVKHTRYLIETLEPTAFVIENPRGVLRKLPFLKGLDLRTLTYCQYGETRMKPTDLWLGGRAQAFITNPVCKNGDPCHEAAPRGAKTGTQGIQGAALRAVVPYALSLSFCEQMEQILAATHVPERLAV